MLIKIGEFDCGEAFETIIPHELESRIFYLDNDCKDIWSWSEKVYEFVKNRER